MSNTHYVEVVELDTGASMSLEGPLSSAQAEEVARDLRVRLNHDKFVARIEERNAFGHRLGCACLACGGY